MEYFTMGIKSIDKYNFNSPKNRNFIKPDGGLWSSPYIENGIFKSNWHEWCFENMNNKLFNYGVVFTLKENSNIFIVNSNEDIKKLFKEYEYKNNNKYDFIKVLDYEKIAKDYDGIHLTSKGETISRFDSPYVLHGWDCESLLLLNIDCIDKWKYIEF